MASEHDLYGFNVTLSQLHVAERAACDDQANAKQATWMGYIEKDRLPNREEKTKELIRQGIPPTCRTWVWMQTSKATQKKASMPDKYYSMMVKEGENSACWFDIEEDCKNTFSSHPWLSSGDGRAARQRVLSAYSIHNEKVGYCYALSMVAGVLLTAMNRNEENAFWLLTQLVETILYPNTYSRNLQGCQIEMNALSELIQSKLPRLHSHLQATETDISLIATDWYLCLFANALPSETVARIWDALFNEGPKILYRVSLALLKLEEEALMKYDNSGEIVMHMRKAASNAHHRDRLMAMAFDGIGSLPMATIDKYREMRASGATSVEAGMANLSVNGQEANAGDKIKKGFGKFMAGISKAYS